VQILISLLNWLGIAKVIDPNIVKLSRSLSGVEAILPTSAPLSQQGSAQPTVYLAKSRRVSGSITRQMEMSA
jgi:hypothetical protein